MKGRILSVTDKLLLSPAWLLALLPLRVLYLISWGVYMVLYYLVGYRRKVVADNLKAAFPEKTDQDRLVIERKFFRHLCDYFMESLYMIRMSKHQASKRFVYTNPELINRLYDEGKSFILLTSHQGNWEWAIRFSLLFRHALIGVYKPLSNDLFDRLFVYLRSRFGGIPVPMKHTLRIISEYRQRKEPFALYMLSDQRPGMEDMNYWTPFMNREVPVITGMDKLARRYNLPVVFSRVMQKKQGFYEVEFELLVEHSQELGEYEIAEKYIRAVERGIYLQPETYLWSHKRWKYNPEQYKLNKQK